MCKAEYAVIVYFRFRNFGGCVECVWNFGILDIDRSTVLTECIQYVYIICKMRLFYI